MRFLFVVHKNEEKAEQNSVLFHRLTLKERGLRPNGYFPLMRQPHLRFWWNFLRNRIDKAQKDGYNNAVINNGVISA